MKGVIPVVDDALLTKYDISAPRYTSYPTAPQFHDGFASADLRAEIARVNAEPAAPPLSLYFHLPFCKSVCFFCGCNVTFTRDRSRPAPYAEVVTKEMDAVAGLLRPGRLVHQLHWGGGTPTFFAPEELGRLFESIRERFSFAPDAEIGIEVDPRETTVAHLDVLGRAGFNRLSLGVQDFDERVQQAVNRVQPADLTRDTIRAARERGFTSISVDLIHGLPHQTEESFARTAEAVLALQPDRIALFNFAYLPDLIRHQKAIDASALPAPREKLAILRRAIAVFTGAGFRFVGMDHFAREDDDLCRAQDAGTLYRNFQGYTTHAGCDLHAFGVSAISSIGRVYAQNRKDVASYTASVATDGLATWRGLLLSPRDEMRRDLIMRILCDFRLDFADFEQRHGIRFREHFAGPLADLEPMRADGLVTVTPEAIEITPVGRLLVRNVCTAFDEYFSKRPGQHFSRTV
jgi:oxygen-independent coproporphyrinogen-3 oxidase